MPTAPRTHRVTQPQAPPPDYHRLYDRRWRKARLRFLSDHPLCATCTAAGRLIPATEVDHVTPHRGDRLLFWDEGNWSALCTSCHKSKSAKERL